ncbi:hypothetical protein [Asanoa ishikariensis]|nr:hypothetical protein [Asanoa ishikariensis]
MAFLWDPVESIFVEPGKPAYKPSDAVIHRCSLSTSVECLDG